MVMSALVFWSSSGRPQASPATLVQKSPNLGLMAFRPATRSGSSSTAFFEVMDGLLGKVHRTRAGKVRPIASPCRGLSVRGTNLVEQLSRGEDVPVEG